MKVAGAGKDVYPVCLRCDCRLFCRIRATDDRRPTTVETSCGIVLLNPRREIFMCRATGTHRWDLPKGIGEPHESARDAAVRETWEEAGLSLPASQLHDLGEFAYLPRKRLHLFALRVALEAFDVSECRCRSTFIHATTKRPTPEVNGYAWKPVAELTQWCGKNMARVLGALRWDTLLALPELASLDVDRNPTDGRTG